MPKNILHTIEKNMSSFSKGQKLIARFILEDYDKAAFMTASKLGKTVQVSESTVVRFATQLGYDGYPSMQRALQEMIRGKLTSIQRIKASEGELSGSDLVTNVLQRDMEKIRMAMDQTDGSEFSHVVDIIAQAKHIYIVGFRSSSFLAGYLNFYFRLIYDNVTQVQGGCRHLRPALPRGSRRCGYRHLLPALLRAGAQDGAVCQGSGRDHHRRDRQRDVAGVSDVLRLAAGAQRDDLVRGLARCADEYAQRIDPCRRAQAGNGHLRDLQRAGARLGSLRHFREGRG